MSDKSLTDTTNRVLLEQEINKIQDSSFQKFVTEAMKGFPDYFWTAPASNELFHPEDERERGGLVLHTRRVCRLIQDMSRLGGLNQWEQDVLLVAGILHDSFARGIPPDVQPGSDIMHPLYPRQRFPFKPFGAMFLNDASYTAIMECVESHQGPWSPSPLLHSNKKLPTILQTVDYIASRSHVRVLLND